MNILCKNVLNLHRLQNNVKTVPLVLFLLCNQIIAREPESGNTHKDITFHAEIEAIRRATESLKTQDFSDCIMYTTHEPCIMCSYIIRFTKIQTIVVGVLTG